MRKKIAILLFFVVIFNFCFAATNEAPTAHAENEWISQFNDNAEHLFGIPKLTMLVSDSDMYYCAETDMTVSISSGETFGRPEFTTFAACWSGEDTPMDKFILTAMCIITTLNGSKEDLQANGYLLRYYNLCQFNKEGVFWGDEIRKGYILGVRKEDGVYTFAVAVK